MTLSVRKQVAISATAGLLAALMVVTVLDRQRSSTSTEFLGGASSQSVSPTSVAVTRQDIRSQFSVPGKIVANPLFIVAAGVAGQLTSERPAALIAAGGVIGEVSGTAVAVPRQVELVEWLVPEGSRVTAELPVAIVRLVGFAVRVEVDGSDGYRLLAGSEIEGRVSIDAGPGPFDCPVVQAAQSANLNPVGSDASPFAILCLIPENVRAITDVDATMLITNLVVSDALALPVTAVRGLVDTGEVALLSDGSYSRRTVQLGVSDGLMVEIQSGLDEGDQVSAAAPPLVGQ
jgi:membrane fusion protein, macrolide-specific efflux system